MDGAEESLRALRGRHPLPLPGRRVRMPMPDRPAEGDPSVVSLDALLETYARLSARSPTPLVEQNLRWRLDFLDDGPGRTAGPPTREAWRRQVALLGDELAARGAFRPIVENLPRILAVLDDGDPWF